MLCAKKKEAEVKKKMDSMRTQYSRYLKSPPSGSGGHHTPRQEWFLRRLKVLELHMKKKTFDIKP